MISRATILSSAVAAGFRHGKPALTEFETETQKGSF